MGFGLTVSVVTAVSEQFPADAITEYVPEVDAVMKFEVAPVFHTSEFPPEAVKEILSPAQIVAGGVTSAVIPGVTVRVTNAVSLQPPFVTATEYVFMAAVALITAVVPPVFQR